MKKAVGANFKKAQSLCDATDSPYKNFNRTYPSGTGWEDYLLWLRKSMHELEGEKIDLCNDAKNEGEDDEEDKDKDDYNKENDDDYKDNDRKDNYISSYEYFKCFFVFSLWGHPLEENNSIILS